jgi:transcription antitermination factor NusG
MNNWLCLQTYSGREYELATQLNKLNIESYAPRYQKVITTSFGITIPYKMPLFRTYLFTTQSYNEKKAAVQQLPCALRSRVVGEVESDLIDELLAREVDGFIQRTAAEKKATSSKPFAQGDVVLIRSGVGFGYEAIFDSYTNDDERVIILANLFNRQVRVPKLLTELALAV